MWPALRWTIYAFTLTWFATGLYALATQHSPRIELAKRTFIRYTITAPPLRADDSPVDNHHYYDTGMGIDVAARLVYTWALMLAGLVCGPFLGLPVLLHQYRHRVGAALRPLWRGLRESLFGPR